MMTMKTNFPRLFTIFWLGILVAPFSAGCQSPYYTDRGALGGGLAGAGIGAIVGDAVGSAGAGTAIGAGIGALTGATIGGAMDEMEARHRAEIAGQLGRPVASGAATIEEVAAMSRAGVQPRLISNYVNSAGVARPITAQDVIYLHQQGVATEVIDTMQRPQVAARPARIASQPGPPVIIQEHVYGPPVYCHPRPHRFYRHHFRHHHHHPHVGFGVSISN